MTLSIKTVALLGANGTMGYGSGVLLTRAGCHVHFLARTLEKAQSGLTAAIEQVRSSTVTASVELGTYEDDLARVVAQADLIFEAVAENFELKQDLFAKIDQYRKPSSIVATVSSGLAITELAKNCSPSFQKNFLGIHFFNPPNVITGTELVPGKNTDPQLVADLKIWCESQLQRNIVLAKDRPGFIGNRIGFKVLNEVAQLAEIHGVPLMDYLIGPYTGRALAPLATIDLVGWDVHQAIVDNVVKHIRPEEDEAVATYHLPSYMRQALSRGVLGNKSGGGFFKHVDRKKQYLDISSGNYLPYEKNTVIPIDFISAIQKFHQVGNYTKALEILANASGPEADIVQKIIGGYISYAFHRLGEVCDHLIDIDVIMATGFNWAPPSVLVDTMGVEATVQLLEKQRLPVPPLLKTALVEKPREPLFQHPFLNTGKYFIAQ